ncbi:prepilin-type N-terminal cleavage/methylation domain-containing protein [Sporosarcina pasteurii]|uniref:Tfp pilus assembly protein PilV n=1 Tax=Sporosarcina pasteurii TaxID=1474 RepID=A0A380BVP3_SPOPA|nr:prepilin-type N-terminal cleavage/methylation domain-containing protein [Sporosarcina pasteurii]MDS9471347.1 prepilin-type N-terminal cleavage/methylation domain-containing protein [Sporosarcina pasteurii]QBQ05025.1 prepilin-type N-terminal cleavage/methylation domain-containing protein [Sporosarcina pasteurii]SUJ07899.1 Tfp pilus assembly protein PilV [Sporosarcina pasteurii]
MQRINVNRKESGLTLIEVLASIVILSIVLISFSSLLLQSTKHTKYNKEKLTAVQVAEDIVAKIRNGDYSMDGETKAYISLGDEKFEVSIHISDGPSNLKLAKITVNSLAKTKKSSFETEMYFEVDKVSP